MLHHISLFGYDVHSVYVFLFSEAVKGNDMTKHHTQAELEDHLSTYFVNARDRKGGRKERQDRRRTSGGRATE